MNLQHLNVKISADKAPVELGDAIPAFHRWIQDNVCEELLIDVVDYRHVDRGPGVMLIGHEASYSLDRGPENRLGLLYNRKAKVHGSTQQKLERAFRAAFEACLRLEEEPALQGKLHFNAGSCEAIVNDRLLVPNTAETWKALQPEFERFFRELFGGRDFRMERTEDPRERFGIRFSTPTPIDVRTLLSARV